MFSENKNITLPFGNMPIIEGRFQVGEIAEFQCSGVFVIGDVFSVVPSVGQVVSGFKKLCPRMGLRGTPVWVISVRGREGGGGHRAGARPRVGLEPLLPPHP